MITVFIDSEDNSKHTLVTQQYEIGTYCIIDSNPQEQFGVEDDETTVHKKFRERFNFIKEESTIL